MDVLEQFVQGRDVHHGLGEGPLLGAGLLLEDSAPSVCSSITTRQVFVLQKVQRGAGGPRFVGSAAVAEAVAMVMRDGKHLLGYSVSNDRHESQVGGGAAGRSVCRVDAVLVALVGTPLQIRPAA